MFSEYYSAEDNDLEPSLYQVHLHTTYLTQPACIDKCIITYI